MHRRDWFRSAALGSTLAASMGLSSSRAQEGARASAARGANVKITDLRAILTQPAGARLVVVKVETNQPGLFGLGCATFTQRARAVETAVNQYLRPFLIGRDALAVEDVYHSAFLSSYWRNGPVLGNAISGVDQALWDILGKHAGLPVYQLFGGKVRRAADTYRHASGGSFDEVTEQVASFVDQSYRHVRIQVDVDGLSTYGAASNREATSERVWEPKPYVLAVPRLFEHVRKALGDKVELLHDVHERVPPILAMQLARDLESYRPFFLEDPFSPEDVGYFENLRRLTTTPIAMGELFNNPNEWLDLVSRRLIDFIRIHISQIGGLTPARKVAALCEFFAVRTAWHGPGDVSPVGHAANLHLDLATPNFGIQEAREFTTEEQDVFPGCPELRDGYLWSNDRPGLGIDLDEALAAKFPIEDDPPFDFGWGELRRLDGGLTKP